jgi:homoserine kinase type II
LTASKSEIINEINRTCKHYDIGKVSSAKLLASGFANQNYKIETEKGKFFYRVCTQQEDVNNIVYEVNILSELKKLNFPTAYLIPRKDGSYMSDSKDGKVLIYEFKDGSEPELNNKTVSEIAKYAATLNNFKGFEKYPRKNVILLDHCFELIQSFKTAPLKYPEIFPYFEEQTNYLIKPLSEKLSIGLIHGDIFPDNTLFNDDRLSAIIDFEEICVDKLLMEIGMCINGFCFVNNELDIGLMETFIIEYNRVREITDKELELLYYYIQWAAHGMISWHLRYYLIYKENLQQLDRVNELMERVKILRQNKLPVNKRFK